MDTKRSRGYRSSHAEVQLEVKTVLKISEFSLTIARVCSPKTADENIFFHGHLHGNFQEFLEKIL